MVVRSPGTKLAREWISASGLKTQPRPSVSPRPPTSSIASASDGEAPDEGLLLDAFGAEVEAAVPVADAGLEAGTDVADRSPVDQDALFVRDLALSDQYAVGDGPLPSPYDLPTVERLAVEDRFTERSYGKKREHVLL